MITQGDNWPELSLFERRDPTGAWLNLSARDIGRAVEDGWLCEADLVRLLLPGKPVRFVAVRDVLSATDGGAGGLDDLAQGPRRGPSNDAAASVGPALNLVQVDATLPVEKLPRSAPARTQRLQGRWSWRQLLTWKILGWVMLGYYMLGTGFWFFITSNPGPPRFS